MESVPKRLQGVQPSGWKLWVLAARPATLPAAIVPVLVGTAAATASPLAVQWLPFLAALMASLLIQVGTNLANDVFDFRRGADATAERLGPTRVTSAGLVSPSSVLRATLLIMGLAMLVGIYLVTVGGWPILLIGVLSILAGLGYTGGPYPLGYHGLGDIFVFIFFGFLAVGGSAYLQAGTISPLALLTAIPVGCLVTAIIVVNNLRDRDGDALVGKKTLAVILGGPATRIEYALLLTLPYMILIPLAMLHGLSWAAALPLLSVPLAIKWIRYVNVMEGRPLNQALKGTGQLHLLNGVLLTAALWIRPAAMV